MESAKCENKVCRVLQLAPSEVASVVFSREERQIGG